MHGEILIKKKISPYYYKNLLNLLNNDILNNYLIQNNITLFYSLHHKMIKTNINNFISNKYIKFIEQNAISNCLSKVNLVITDFSSIIFDLIYRNKPFIIVFSSVKKYYLLSL